MNTAKEWVAKLEQVMDDGLKSLHEFRERMSRPGIAFTKEQEETIRALVEADKIVDAQAIILDELEQKHGT